MKYDISCSVNVSRPVRGDGRRLEVWLCSAMPELDAPLKYRLLDGGRSNLTFLVEGQSGKRVVLRRPPFGAKSGSAHNMAREFRIVRGLADSLVPVPVAHALCDDAEVDDTPMWVMSYIEGSCLRTKEDALSWAPPSSRASAAKGMISALAEIHQVDLKATGLSDLASTQNYVSRQISRWIAQLDTSESASPRSQRIRRAGVELLEIVPNQTCTTLVHGDFRLDNLLFDASGAVLAVLDWELCTVGDPLADLAGLVVQWQEPGETGPGYEAASCAPGFPDRGLLVDWYADATGTPIHNLNSYIGYASWRLACILETVLVRYEAGLAGGDHSRMEGFGERADDLLASVEKHLEAV